MKTERCSCCGMPKDVNCMTTYGGYRVCYSCESRLEEEKRREERAIEEKKAWEEYNRVNVGQE